MLLDRILEVSLDPGLLRHGRPQKSLQTLVVVGARGTCRGGAGLPGANALHDADTDGLHPRGRSGNHGIHFDRRTAASSP